MTSEMTGELVGLAERWRHALHAMPELAFNEHATADFVAARLAEFGIETHRGLAGTGVVGILRNGEGPSIGLRADMDCVAVTEATGLPYASGAAGRMHACGHDGHMAMLLGAAGLLAQTRRFKGTLVLIFQPGEENEAGGRRMVEDGLFDRFPVDRVFGLHNWPDLPLGRIAVRPGPMMAACDLFDITLTGKGCHAAMPHKGIDPIPAACAVVSALQTLTAREIDPQEAGVVSVTQVHAGDAYNVIPHTATLRGTVRWFDEATGRTLREGVERIATAVATAHRCTASVSYDHRYPPTVNDAQAADFCRRVAEEAFGEGNVVTTAAPSMGAEDFAFMLARRPGAYAWLGTGEAGAAKKLHSPHYDFNDRALEYGIRYWVALGAAADE